jgi:hypothetical protein
MKIVDGKSDEWCGKHLKFNLIVEDGVLKNIETGEEEPNIIYKEDTIIIEKEEKVVAKKRRKKKKKTN